MEKSWSMSKPHDGTLLSRSPGRSHVVALGDSITKGVRAGVGPEETFAAMSERALKAEGIGIEIVNFGIGGERTDQALKRLDAVYKLRPQVVTVMYGTNDSYVNNGAGEPHFCRGVLHESQGDRRGIAVPGHRAGPHDRAALGRGRPA